MKYSIFTIALLSLLGSMASIPAYADNKEVEDAVHNQPNLSSFYRALMDSGVNHELDENKIYTVFAPTNEAMAKIRKDQYPCFYRPECHDEVAKIVRNHITVGAEHIHDMIGHKGGFFSIGSRFVGVGELFRIDPAVEGHGIIEASFIPWTDGSVVYNIDKVIANPRELRWLRYAEYRFAPSKEETSTARKIVSYPSCGPDGCPDETKETTVITQTIVTPVTPTPAK